MDKKNTLLLTVIAVATLLVAIVGATFAYFTAQMGEGANTNIVVTTSTQDTLSYSTFNTLMIIANEDNFAKGKGTQTATAQGTISLQANSNQTDEAFKTADYCYTATINVTANQFTYAPQDVVEKTTATGNDAELVLTITKDDRPYENGEITGLTYVTKTDQKVCDQTTLGTNAECVEHQSFSGYDITEYGNATKTPDGPTEIKIPNTEADAEATQNEQLKYVFHIKAEKAGAITTHDWQADLYFVNYDWDQQYNTHKMFTATWSFETVSCETGLKE